MISGDVAAESPTFRGRVGARPARPARRRHRQVLPGAAARRRGHPGHPEPQAVAPDRPARHRPPQQPVFSGDGGDVPAEPLKPYAGIGPVDVEGGWFDAGDFVKFTHATAYSLAEMLYLQREIGNHLHPEPARPRTACAGSTRCGTSAPASLYVQVGLGTGSETFGFLGDHDVWRLPEADDALDTGPGDEWQYIKYRPVFRARRSRRTGQPQPGRPRARPRSHSPRRPPRSPVTAGGAGLVRRGRVLAVRAGEDDQRRRVGDGVPARVLPGGHLAGRHGVRGGPARAGGKAVDERGRATATYATPRGGRSAYLDSEHG